MKRQSRNLESDETEQNDYDRLAAEMRAALSAFTGNMHEPPRGNESDSVTITKDGALTGIIRLQRAIDWCQGLADSHRRYSSIPEPGG